MNNLISIIIPVNNLSKYILSCLDSIKKQSYRNFECIIVDHFSHDDSCYKIESFIKKDLRFKLIKMQYSYISSSAEAIEYGMKFIRGKYVTFIDGDDSVDVLFLEKLIKNILSSNADIVISGGRAFDEKNKLSLCSFYAGTSLKYFNLFCKRKISTRNLISDNIFMVDSYYWGKLFSSEFLENNNIHFNLSYGNVWNDQQFTVQYLLKNPRISFLYEDLYVYRINRLNSVTSAYKFSNFWLRQFLSVLNELYVHDSNDIDFFKRYFISRFDDLKQVDNKEKVKNMLFSHGFFDMLNFSIIDYLSYKVHKIFHIYSRKFYKLRLNREFYKKLNFFS